MIHFFDTEILLISSTDIYASIKTLSLCQFMKKLIGRRGKKETLYISTLQLVKAFDSCCRQYSSTVLMHVDENSTRYHTCMHAV